MLAYKRPATAHKIVTVLWQHGSIHMMMNFQRVFGLNTLTDLVLSGLNLPLLASVRIRIRIRIRTCTWLTGWMDDSLTS